MKRWFPSCILALGLLTVAVSASIAAAQSQAGGTSNASTGSAQSTTTQPLPDSPAGAQSATGTAAPAQGSAAQSSPPPAASPSSTGNGADPEDSVLGASPLPKNAKATLIGGIATSVDRVRNRVTVQPFGAGKKLKIFFDDRSHIYRDGRETTVLAINKGDRVYADTILVGPQIFATNLRVQTASGPAESRGQIESIDGDTMEVRDQLSGQVVAVHLPDDAKISRVKGSATRADLKPGTLVSMSFTPVSRNENTVKELQILASPGDTYQFYGKVTHLDLSRGVLAIDNQSDGRTYEVHFDPALTAQARQLNVGSQVNTVAIFDGTAYNARNLEVSEAAQE